MKARLKASWKLTDAVSYPGIRGDINYSFGGVALTTRRTSSNKVPATWLKLSLARNILSSLSLLASTSPSHFVFSTGIIPSLFNVLGVASTCFHFPAELRLIIFSFDEARFEEPHSAPDPIHSFFSFLSSFSFYSFGYAVIYALFVTIRVSTRTSFHDAPYYTCITLR